MFAIGVWGGVSQPLERTKFGKSQKQIKKRSGARIRNFQWKGYGYWHLPIVKFRRSMY